MVTRSTATTSSAGVKTPAGTWAALWAMLIGYFMVLVDSTILAVANPTIMSKLNTDYDSVIWVTSAYLLAYAVPLVLAGRLGDRFGLKNVYLVGLFVFTTASLLCGLSDSISVLVANRVAQGIGAALITPQTLSIISRTFPPERRGAATSAWGATAGVATLVGPVAGGILLDGPGWEWIFFVNIPVGLVGFALAVWLVPPLPGRKHSFDPLGVALSGIAIFCIVLGLQEGQPQHWSWQIWTTIVIGLVFIALFALWEWVNRGEPLVPLAIFRDRNFSVSTLGYAIVGFVVTSSMLPVFFYAQVVCELSPTRSALLVLPISVAMVALVPLTGKLVDRVHPRLIVGLGFLVLAIGAGWLSVEMTPTTPIWRLALAMAVIGTGLGSLFAPLAAAAQRSLPIEFAGAGSGVFNAIRQVGSVMGSAGMAALLSSRVSAELPPLPGGRQAGEATAAQLPAFLHPAFSTAMSQSMRLPAIAAVVGALTAMFLVGLRNSGRAAGS
jgi:EmrB/QacA subfamily drug resistance transporter